MTRKNLGIPYMLFLILFVVFPLIIVIYYALTDGQGNFTIDNFLSFFSNPYSIGTLGYSAFVALTTTLLCLVIGFPVAYVLSKGAFAGRTVFLMMCIMPMWINFTLRITALKEVLDFVEGNLAYYPFLNTILGETYDFLPFMILPLYNTMEKMDLALLEAAKDLGAGGFTVFWRVMVPLSLPGIISGVTMVFLPAMTNYVVLDMLYNSTYIMGSLIGSYFSSYDWHNGSMISAVLLLLIMMITYAINYFSGEGEEA